MKLGLPLVVLVLLTLPSTGALGAGGLLVRNPLDVGLYNPLLNEARKLVGDFCEVDFIGPVQELRDSYATLFFHDPTNGVRSLQLAGCDGAEEFYGEPPQDDGRSTPTGDDDKDGDGMGDTWEDQWLRRAGQVLDATVDSDDDGLLNLDEFQWELTPVCGVPGYGDCRDSDANSVGANGDGWLDGPEVTYWNNKQNDALATVGAGVGQALYDPDRLLDTDGDQRRNVDDVDADNDGLLDGEEAQTYNSYPELPDSDCAVTAVPAPCTLSKDSGLTDDDRQGQPGTGDRLNDRLERDAWNLLGANAYKTDFDGDGIAFNLLDPDADGDRLLDGQEFATTQIRADLRDTDSDGVLDGDEVAWDQDSDGDGLVNANDGDSDNDGMPDKWEVDHAFDMTNPLDAGLDRDGDKLSNLGEHQYRTNPDDMDSEGSSVGHGDGLLDGEEIANRTDPLHWDTDRDELPDRFEVDRHLNPTSSSDRNADGDGDSFDLGNDGAVDRPWGNLVEYRYGRPSAWSETERGPWPLGTHPDDPDTDDDGGPDGYESYYGTNPLAPDVNNDADKDGLTFTQEAKLQTNPYDPDTDHDGLCDGGRAEACRLPAVVSTEAYQAGERDYRSSAWIADSDGDGLNDAAEVVLWDPNGQGTALDADGDRMNGLIDPDNDGDGLSDFQEQVHVHTNPKLADTDNDSLSDGREVRDPYCQSCKFQPAYLDPLKADTDGDLLLDYEELGYLTYPNQPDTDGDGLRDDAEVRVYHTDPRIRDTDGDRVSDGVEAGAGTNPLVDDMRVDLDQDGLSNGDELMRMPLFYGQATRPDTWDTDNDGAPDGWEVGYRFYGNGFNPVNWVNGDYDGDGFLNNEEYLRGLDPILVSTDRDGISDSDEFFIWFTDPLNPDSDGDGLLDGDASSTFTTEAGLWLMWGSYWGDQSKVWQDCDGDKTRNNLLDADSDNDGLDDGDEWTASGDYGTNPCKPDTDNDGLTDYEEVRAYRGRFNPVKWDTDGDGIRDGDELSSTEPLSDPDDDGFTNAQEDAHGTDKNNADSDCDGVQDGPEANYWGNQWNVGGNRLRNSDVDRDGIADGLEIGWVGYKRNVLYHTDPAKPDTDGDGLQDGQEDRNALAVSCGGVMYSASTPSIVPNPIPLPVPDRVPLPLGTDARGLYIQGAYGVNLYIQNPLPDDPTDLSFLHDVARPSSANTPNQENYRSDPTKGDTDGDGINDGAEVHGTLAGKASDPTKCDSDGDGLGDALENGVFGLTKNMKDTCRQRDGNVYTRTDPANQDSDDDGLLDGAEDTSLDGLVNPGEADPADGDTDDDGLLDSSEVTRTLPDVADTDLDGLSDGLESGLPEPQTTLTKHLDWTNRDTLLESNCYTGRKAWQQLSSQASRFLTTPDDADLDNDGLLDGLEDLNHNGWVDAGELDATLGDSDNDGLGDGLELLTWGQPAADGTHGRLTYDFCKIASVWGSSDGAIAPHLAYNSAEPFQTNPRNPNTDMDEAHADGSDLNPRGDAAVNLEFGNFRMTQGFDDCDDKVVELYISQLKVDLPFNLGSYVLHTPTDEYVNIPDAMNAKLLDSSVLAKLLDDVSPPSTGQTLWNAALLAGRPGLQLDIPEDIGNPANLDTSNRNVKVAIQFYDQDDWGCNGNSDPIDLNPDSAKTELELSLNVVQEKAGDYFPDGGATKEPSYSIWGGRLETSNFEGDQTEGKYEDGMFDSDRDASLQFRLGDSVSSFFAEHFNLQGYVPQTGNCFGGSGCLQSSAQ